ncbi:3,4-dihydroxy-2-butanone-4-phosphate synthase [Nesterenkonia halobia]|uniref:GTP cyclohydrolase-2 n=1 Tax=Nesterenkonia halobia TaxID=37922 RepID=A0ABP6RD42_9MICC
MFTGIITGLGTVVERRSDPARGVERLTVDAPGHAEDLPPGGSIAVDGVCVSATSIEGEHIAVDLIQETLRRTTLGRRAVGDRVNLERCVPSGTRLDGHVVQGHVDGLGELLARDVHDGRHRVAVPAELAPYLAEKGSIAVDGVSLTVTAVSDPGEAPAWFEVGLIPTTLAETTLGRREIGDALNLEVDVLAKYARRMLRFSGDLAAAELAAEDPAAAVPAVAAPTTPEPVLDPVEVALNQLAQGRPVVVVDDADRENEGDLILPAALADEELMAFTVRHSSGVVCAPMSAERAAHLDLPAMVAENEDPKGTAYTVSVDAAAGVTTGISAADRARTLQVLADSGADAAALTRPGHIFPLVAHADGVLGRSGHTEAAVDLCRLAGTSQVGAIAELVHDDGRMMRVPALREFADAHGLALISIADLVDYRGGTVDPTAVRDAARASWDSPSEQARALVTPGPVVTLPTDHGIFAAQVWAEHDTGHEHLLISARSQAPAEGGDGVDAAGAAPLIRLHSECITGDVLGSHRCDCGTQLASALESIQRDGGHLLYLRGHEGRGIGLANKLRAYQLQEEGADTVEANEMLGLAAELRDYTGAAAILHSCGLTRVRLLTNNPEKVAALQEAGLDVEQVPSEGEVHDENRRYLRTKRDRMHHLMDHLGDRLGLGETPTEAPDADGRGEPAEQTRPLNEQGER